MPPVPAVIFDPGGILKAASLPLCATKVSNTRDMPTWSTGRDTLYVTPSNFTQLYIHVYVSG